MRIELGEIEVSLCRHVQTKEAVVIVREDIPDNKRLSVYITAHGKAPGIEELRWYMQQELTEDVVPFVVVVLGMLSLSNTTMIWSSGTRRRLMFGFFIVQV